MAEKDEGEHTEALMAVMWGWCPGRGGWWWRWLRTAALGWGLRAHWG